MVRSKTVSQHGGGGGRRPISEQRPAEAQTLLIAGAEGEHLWPALADLSLRVGQTDSRGTRTRHAVSSEA